MSFSRLGVGFPAVSGRCVGSLVRPTGPASSSSSSSFVPVVSSLPAATVRANWAQNVFSPVMMRPWTVSCEQQQIERKDPSVKLVDDLSDQAEPEQIKCDNLIRKRRRKMNKHKHSKMLKKQRFLRRKLGK